MSGRRCALWLAAAISVLFLTTTTVANGASRERPCNGSADLCGRSLDQVVLPGTHNSMSNEEQGWTLPNQHYSIPTQLNMGIRAFLIDTYYGKAAGNGVVAKVSLEQRNDPGVKMYLCHEYCQLGSSELIPELAAITTFLAAHPREVLVFVVQDKLVPEDLAAAVTQSGLIDYVYRGPTGQYPALREMIASNQRVVMLSERSTGAVPWYHSAYDGPMQETPYNFRSNEAGDALTTRQGMGLLTGPATLDSTCRPYRGGTTGNLFLMNHWVDGKFDNSDAVTHDPAVAKVLNRRSVLVDRAAACEERRGKLPNIVAVDDFGEGNLITAVRELNGLTRPVLSVRRPARRVVRAGRKATFKVRIANRGDENAFKAKLCAIVPRRLAIRPRCRTFGLAQGRARVIRLTVKTRRRARGSGKVRIKVRGRGGVATARANLRVKPLKKKRPHRRKRR